MNAVGQTKAFLQCAAVISDLQGTAQVAQRTHAATKDTVAGRKVIQEKAASSG
ncbi:MAG: hypothetical protein NTZ90_09095 [Proteobacteria bacterium]|nr:hypothetical protein [Pseudomonadota bacterium]